SDFGQYVVRDRPPWRDIAAVVDAPYSKKTLRLVGTLKITGCLDGLRCCSQLTSAGDEHACAGYHNGIPGARRATFGSAGDDPQRFHIAAVSAIENPQATAAGCE